MGRAVVNIEEMAKLMFEMTVEYMNTYFALNKVDTLNKELIAALHIGICMAFRAEGYEPEFTDSALSLVQKMLAEKMPESFSVSEK